MTSHDMGSMSLSLAVLLMALSMLLAVAAARFESRYLLGLAKFCIGLFAALMTLASLILFGALAGGDFSNAYVTRYTEQALPIGYKLAAFWAGQEGSLLLWAWMLGVMSLVAVVLRREGSIRESAGVIATLALVSGFFAALLLFAANPFTPLAVPPADGMGLNPMLQDPGMLAHPPALFLGYAGYTIPFAFLVGALVSRSPGNDWLKSLRLWSLFSWLALSVGILLGAQWAYVELGWGGYWAWDPVENASLLPWLTGTALLHTIMPQHARHMFKRWNAWLIAVTFILCILGTYLTRSGILEAVSVHSFPKSSVGTFFLVFMAVIVAASAALILANHRKLTSHARVESLLTREGAFLLANILLVLMTVATLLGTVYPVISSVLLSRPVSVGQPFYNSVVVPMGVALVALMAFGPVLTSTAPTPRAFLRRLLIPLLLGTAALLGLLALNVLNPWALVCGFIAALAAGCIADDLMRCARQRQHMSGEWLLTAFVRLMDANHRRYGGQIVHVGMMVMVLGIAGSSLYSREESFQMRPGQSVTFAGNTLRFDGLREVERGNYATVKAVLTVTDPRGRTTQMLPERRFYQRPEQSINDVAIRSSWDRDLYLILAGWEAGGQITAIKAHMNPLVGWIWIGAWITGGGALLCLLPRLLPHPAPAPAAAHTTARKTMPLASANTR